jgi:hypothetical protein
MKTIGARDMGNVSEVSKHGLKRTRIGGPEPGPGPERYLIALMQVCLFWLLHCFASNPLSPMDQRLGHATPLAILPVADCNCIF